MNAAIKSVLVAYLIGLFIMPTPLATISVKEFLPEKANRKRFHSTKSNGLLDRILPFAEGSDYHEQIADAIFWAEGGYKAEYPYGIRSVPCNGYDDCRKICLNTIYNTLVKYRSQRCFEGEGDIPRLARRYAPEGAKNDPNGLNKNWFTNVKYFLKHPKQGVPK